MIDKLCPQCNQVHPASVARTYDAGTYAGEYEAGGTEWQCSNCHARWTVRIDRPEECYAFFPPDIPRLFETDEKPFFVGA